MNLRGGVGFRKIASMTPDLELQFILIVADQLWMQKRVVAVDKMRLRCAQRAPGPGVNLLSSSLIDSRLIATM